MLSFFEDISDHTCRCEEQELVLKLVIEWELRASVFKVKLEFISKLVLSFSILGENGNCFDFLNFFNVRDAERYSNLLLVIWNCYEQDF